MNWLDIVLVAVLFITITSGWRRGLIRQLFDVTTVFASYIVALRYGTPFVLLLDKYVAPLAEWLPTWFSEATPLGFALGEIILRLIGFFILFFLVRLVFRLVGGLLHEIFCLPILGTINGLGGSLLGLIKGLLFMLIIVAVGQLIHTPFWQQSLQQSAIASFVIDILPLVYEQMVRFLFNTTLPTV